MERDMRADEIRLLAALRKNSSDWCDQPRGVWDGETLERELDEQFPVEVGLQALQELKGR